MDFNKLPMSDINLIQGRAEEGLNTSRAEYEAASDGHEREFRLLVLQFWMFQFEMCHEMASFIRFPPSGFAESVALKGIVHKLYEFDQYVNNHLASRIVAFARDRGINASLDEMRHLRKTWKAELKVLASWRDIRNKVTGHYDGEIERQIALIETIPAAKVMPVVEAFLAYNKSMLLLLRDAGYNG